MNLTTLCYIEKNNQYLMLHRIAKEHDINKDKWIGMGGHFEYGESPEDCLLREVKEETGLTLISYRFRGLVTFLSDKCAPEYMCLYTSNNFQGTLTECDEGTLQWIEKKKILTLPLWTGDHIFLNLIEEDIPFFSLKLRYTGDTLVEAILNGVSLGTGQIAIRDTTNYSWGRSQL
ncbi:MAG: 8-oxo-dGTP diphosphatase [Lachnospiraceae bacterium]